MAASEKSPEDKQKLKAGIMGIIILVICGTAGPWIMGEMTGIDPDSMCVEKEGEDPICPEGELGEKIVSESKIAFQLYLPLGVFIIGVIFLAIVGLKY